MKKKKRNKQCGDFQLFFFLDEKLKKCDEELTQRYRETLQHGKLIHLSIQKS